ncbi:MAG: hypothetical protein JO332_13730, partial [Planctomycetaceae bacterium]|nr:hypothetical protein [Planctomycetaceae bacterium]
KLKALADTGTAFQAPAGAQGEADLAHLTETYSQVSELVGRPYYEIRDRLNALMNIQVENAPWYAELTRQMTPSFVKIVERTAQAEASIGAAKVAAALKLYRTQNGQYPVSLSELGSVLPVAPVDPFSGRPYIYRREGSGFVVYSVGKAGVDTGGIADPASLDRHMVIRVPK